MLWFLSASKPGVGGGADGMNVERHPVSILNEYGQKKGVKVTSRKVSCQCSGSALSILNSKSTSTGESTDCSCSLANTSSPMHGIINVANYI